jgi:hypothetical protein
MKELKLEDRNSMDLRNVDYIAYVVSSFKNLIHIICRVVLLSLYVTALSTAQIIYIYHWVIGSSVKDELENIWEEVIVVYFTY